MYDELTRSDIRKMQEEIDDKLHNIRPKMIEDLKTARGFGDLSENFEYKSAKQAIRHLDSRIRYLQRMIATARVIEDRSMENTVGLYDKITVYIPEDDECETYQIVTTLRQNTLKNLVSKDSPLGRAVMGKKAGSRVKVKVSESYSYEIEIRSIEKGADDDSIPISSF